MLRDMLLSTAWFSRLMASARAERRAGAASIVACDEPADTPQRPLMVGDIEIHALDPTGYGVFRHQGRWLVTHGGTWFRSVHVAGPYLPVATRMVPLALVAMVAQACERQDIAAPGFAPTTARGARIAVQPALAASDT